MELRQAAALLALAMTSGEILSGCGKAPPEPITPTVVPETSAQGGASDLAALRRAAAIVDEWHRRDPAQTEGVLREHGLFACDENTTACIAAKHAADVSLAPAVEAPAPSVAPSASPLLDVRVGARRAPSRRLSAMEDSAAEQQGRVGQVMA